MAKQIITKMVDDLDGGEADETVHFALDGVGYEIDLSEKNASELRKFLATYQDAGTRTGRVESGKHAQLRTYRPAVASTGLNRDQNQKIRTWAAQNGWELSDRGRIPQMVVDAYESKTPNPEWLAKQNAARKLADETAANGSKTRARKAAKAAPKAEFAS